MMRKLVMMACAAIAISISISSCVMSLGRGRATQADTIPNTDGFTLIGKWVKSTAGRDTASVGFELKEDSSIAAINARSMAYKSWNVSAQGDSLTLVTERIASGKTVADTAKYLCVLRDDTLVLVAKGHQSIYTRKSSRCP